MIPQLLPPNTLSDLVHELIIICRPFIAAADCLLLDGLLCISDDVQPGILALNISSCSLHSFTRLSASTLSTIAEKML